MNVGTVKKSVKMWGLALCVVALFFCSTAWSEELLKATITGNSVNMRSAPNTKGKVLTVDNTGAVLFVGRTPIYDKEGKMNWYRIFYRYTDGMDGPLLDDCTSSFHPNKLYISAQFIKTQSIGSQDMANIKALQKTAKHAEPVLATVTGKEVNMRLSPSIKGKKHDWKVNTPDIFIVDPEAIYDKEGKMSWHKVLYWYWEDEGYIVDLGTRYISANFVKITKMDRSFADFFESEKKSIARDKQYRKSGAWSVQEFKMDDTAVPFANKPIRLYKEPDLKSKVIATLEGDTPIRITLIKRRYNKSLDDVEGWVKIVKPMEGWLQKDNVSIWHSGVLPRL